MKKANIMKAPIITTCSKCSQLLFIEKPTDKPLCDACNVAVKSKYDKYLNFALIRALRAHKYLKTA